MPISVIAPSSMNLFFTKMYGKAGLMSRDQAKDRHRDTCDKAKSDVIDPSIAFPVLLACSLYFFMAKFYPS